MSSASSSHPMLGLSGLDRVCERDIYPHVFQNSDREVGGFLIGRPSVTGQLPLLSGAVEALHATENRADLTFTQDTWEHVHRELDRRGDADKRIVGWYHSHPGFGIFLSRHDHFVHQSFFSDPSQVALVIDPVRRREGLFVWNADELTPMFDRATPVKWATAEEPQDGRAARRQARRASPVLVHLAVLLVGVLAGLGLYFAILPAEPPIPPAVTPAKPAEHSRPESKTGPSPAQPRGRHKNQNPHQRPPVAVQAEQAPARNAQPPPPSDPSMHVAPLHLPAGTVEIEGR